MPGGVLLHCLKYTIYTCDNCTVEEGEEATIMTVCCPEHSNNRDVWCIFNMLCVIKVWREPSGPSERQRERARGADSVSLKESRHPQKEGGRLVVLFF